MYSLSTASSAASVSLPSLNALERMAIQAGDQFPPPDDQAGLWSAQKLVAAE